MGKEELVRIVEAVIFAAEEPLSERRLLGILADLEVSAEELAQALTELRQTTADRPYELVETGGGVRFMTKPAYARWIMIYRNKRAETRLSRAAVETLAIVAYKQPIVRSEIEAIRGVQTGPALRTLMERGLIKIIGRSTEIGRPVQYGTSERFLEFFGLRSLEDLPKPEEI